MRDIREDLKERVASVTAEMDDLKKRQSLLTSIQQSLFGLLEEEDRRSGIKFHQSLSPHR